MPKYELSDTINGMVSPDYKERFIAEYVQTKVRFHKLHSFIGKIKYAKYAGQEEPKHDCPTELLEKQLLTMGLYLTLLEVRAEKFENIKLPVVEEFAPKANEEKEIVKPESKKNPKTSTNSLELFLNNAKVGDIIKVKFKDGKEYEIVKYHDGVIGTRDCPFSHVMNEDWDKEADWNTCDMKPFIEKWFDDNAPDELKELCSVTIPSVTNIFGDKYKGTRYNDDESEIQWDYFKDWHNRVKTILDESANEEGWWYWTKSKRAGYSVSFVNVYSNGGASNDYANITYGVALCFLKK